MRVSIIFSFMSVFCFLAQAQTNVSYSPASGLTGTSTLNTTIMSDNSVSGSVYLFKNWENLARLYTDNDKVFSVKNINFNMDIAEFSVELSKDSIFTFQNIDKVEVNGKRFKKVQNKFYEVLYTFKDNKMFLKEYIVKIEPELHLITNTVIGPGKYVTEEHLYLYKNDAIEKFWPNKKNVLNVLNSEKSAVVKYKKNRKLSYTKEEDLVQMFQYYDTL
ncbi:hypothetical protein [Winogradskyella bathintestinalis]|uniref:Uncharacterized protein n=1 Tax=Winogradskyella bathintestinalis TaxID=3035208 RepID=A0ABT7ZUH0_9FLAO|nr:hypothetical protein [Winogradskyella bathintestinalis]MDN3492640.1 hypothetical protein [Winogradskyella bathintestinalis]